MGRMEGERQRERRKDGRERGVKHERERRRIV